MSKRDELREAFDKWLASVYQPENKDDTFHEGVVEGALHVFDEFIAPLVEALEEIKQVRYGLDVAASTRESEEYWAKLAIEYRNKSTETLRDLYAKLGVKHD